MRTTTRGIPLRHQTLHASLQSSYELLDEAEQRLFRRLSVFRGGWTLPAAEAVCDDPEACDVPVMERLGRLLDKSLVRVHQATEGSRYSFLESVAAFARAQLEGAGEAEEFDDRLTNWCLDLVAAAEPHLRSEEQSDWLALLGREGDNLRLAVRRVLNAGDGPTALRFTALLWPSWRRKSTVDGWNMLEEALRLPGAELPGPDRLRALIAASFAAALCGTFERAMDHAHAAVELARGLEDRRSEVVAMYSWSATLVAFGDRDEGERQLATAIELAELEADPVLIGMVCSEIGWSAMARGEYARALAFLERGLDNLRQAGDLMEEALTLSRLGVLAIAVNDLDRAEERLRESMGLRERIGDRAGIAQVLNNLGCVYEDRGDFEAAAEAYEGSRDLALELGHGTHYGIAASNVCLARLLLGDVEGAKHQMREFFHMTVGA
ncbi:MAG: tetratricopeptide repeat protein, partial [Anaerolineae bacterium]